MPESFLAHNVIEKETMAQEFSCELCEIFKNTFFIEHIWWLLLKNKLTLIITEMFFEVFIQRKMR